MATNIVRFDPFEDLTRLQRDVNRLFEDNVRPTRGAEQASLRAWAPVVDIREDRDYIQGFFCRQDNPPRDPPS